MLLKYNIKNIDYKQREIPSNGAEITENDTFFHIIVKTNIKCYEFILITTKIIKKIWR